MPVPIGLASSHVLSVCPVPTTRCQGLQRRFEAGRFCIPRTVSVALAGVRRRVCLRRGLITDEGEGEDARFACGIPGFALGIEICIGCLNFCQKKKCPHLLWLCFEHTPFPEFNCVYASWSGGEERIFFNNSS
ncbi:hypothetical protein LX36DRAFT_218454 [Colletotrichum falcatum]|nr:hypothetical protein LX36DRAFT_218454 [Colletotrichum falcatum]